MISRLSGVIIFGGKFCTFPKASSEYAITRAEADASIFKSAMRQIVSGITSTRNFAILEPTSQGPIGILQAISGQKHELELFREKDPKLQNSGQKFC